MGDANGVDVTLASSEWADHQRLFRFGIKRVLLEQKCFI